MDLYGLSAALSAALRAIGVVVLLALAIAVPCILHHAASHAASAGVHHAEADESVAGATRVVGCIAHDVDDLALLHHRVGAELVTVDLLLAGLVERYRLNGEADQTDTTGTDGLVEHALVHHLFHLVGVAGQLEDGHAVFAVAHLVEHVLEGCDDLAAHLLSDVLLFHHIGRTGMVAHEDAHVVEFEGVFAVAAHVDAQGVERSGHLVRDGV